jgi:hypothetical protein
LWSDRRRLSVAHDLFERLDDFRASDFVSHALGPQNRADYLGDYLAYADAALQDFLSTGSEQSFHRGLSVLTKARELFEVDLGVWNVVHCNPGTSSMEGLQGAELIGGPQLADDECESCVARVIRLTNAYGRLLHGGTVTANAQANSLEMDALSATNRFSSAAAPWRKMDGRSAVDVAQIAGYYCAAASVVDERYAAHAFVVGPRCRQIADQLFRIVPTHMVACCTGSVRRDLQRLPPGIYVMGRDERPSRPLSLIEAIAEFRRRDPSATAPDTP